MSVFQSHDLTVDFGSFEFFCSLLIVFCFPHQQHSIRPQGHPRHRGSGVELCLLINSPLNGMNLEHTGMLRSAHIRWVGINLFLRTLNNCLLQGCLHVMISFLTASQVSQEPPIINSSCHPFRSSSHANGSVPDWPRRWGSKCFLTIFF